MFFSVNVIDASDVNLTDNYDDNLTVVNWDAVQLDDDNSSLKLTGDGNNPSLTISSKNKTQFSSPTNSLYYGGNYALTLTDSNTNFTLANKSVTFVINDVQYTNATGIDGIVNLNFKLNPGKYQITAYFYGDSEYESCTMTSEMQVMPTIKAQNISKYYGGSTKYKATFYDSYAKLLKNTEVSITVNGKTYSKKTSSAGSVEIALNLKPGTYKITAKDLISGYSLTTTFKVLSTITASDVKNVVGDSKKFTAKFLKSNGKALAKQYVKFKINGKKYAVKTNSNGKAGLSLNKLKKGTYKIISYNKDGLTKANIVKIYPRASTKLSSQYFEFVPGDVKSIRAKFSTSLNDDSCAGKTVKITIGGKTYSKKTNANGYVSLSVESFKKGIYSVQYKFSGNKFFKASQTTNLLTIIDNASDTGFVVKSTTRFGYGANTPLKVAFTAGGVPLPKRTLTFTINGVNYARTTDNDGIASIPINLDLGNHKIYLRSDTQFNVSGISGVCDINVFERSNASKLTWKSGTSYKDNLQTFKVLLTDKDGKPISGQTVELTIDDDVYTGKTASDGYAIIKSSVAIGKYKVSVTSLGDNNYLPTSTSKSISVKVSKFGSGLNVKNTVSSLSAYLKSTKNCQVNNAKIKSLVKSLTSGITDDVDKAKALFNYVRDNVVYDYYYDSHNGAVGTLNAKSANCVDQAHLLIAMYRAAGFAARYVHGTCRFSDGVYGHVWTQVLIGNTWIVGDPISYKNSLGKIKNWNPDTYKLKNRYITLPF